MKSLGHKLAAPGSVMALICFFVPWMTVSCGDRISTVSGWQIATGGMIPTNMGPEERRGDLFVLIALLAAVGILAVALLAWRSQPTRRDGFAIAGLSALALLILLGRFASNQTDTSGDVDVIVQYHPGFFGTVLGFGLALVGGVVDWVRLRSKRSPPPG